MKTPSILYLLNQFPVLSQVFILNEITGFLDLGYNVHIVSLRNPRAKKVHNSVKEYGLMNRTIYLEYYTMYSRMKLFKEGISVVLTDKTLTLKEKFQLLHSCFHYDKKGSGVKWFLSCLAIIKIVREKEIDHIHCHFAGRNVQWAFMIYQVTKIPYTFTTHATDIFVDNPYQDIKKWADHAKKVITISEFNKKYMHKKFNIPLEKIEIIPCSKYLDKLEPVQEYSLSPFRIISVSRLVEKKGYRYLIQACKILKDKGISFSCTIHGDGDERANLERLIQENALDHEVTLGSALTHDQVIAFMKTGSVFVLPCVKAHNNDMDGLPNVLLESMAIQIPTISTTISAIPELIQHDVNGILVSPNDPVSLSEAILKVKQQPMFTESIRKAGREWIVKAFDVNTNVRKLGEILKDEVDG